ncbi:hypothetical protein M0812_23539 [Anaeramoeba flamelloides]|uniref:VASt domain-containing protein n=1 Tax=Anaeramoeba flamelloides TaxID=1746091 RepID=A0AAV7YQ09_9EUKA|nr:hypothetical protein M0812_23539 [Anaeramoeba flamelloides]
MKNKKLREKFKLPQEEKLVSNHLCALKKKILHQGRLYLSENHFCFSSKIGSLKLVVPLSEVTKVIKKSTFFYPKCVIVCTKQEPNGYTFASFVTRGAAYRNLKLLVSNRSLTRNGLQKSNQDPNKANGSDSFGKFFESGDKDSLTNSYEDELLDQKSDQLSMGNDSSYDSVNKKKKKKNKNQVTDKEKESLFLQQVSSFGLEEFDNDQTNLIQAKGRKNDKSNQKKKKNQKEPNDNNIQPESIRMKGYLRIYEENSDRWLNRYCICSDTSLFFWRNEYRSKLIKKVELGNCIIGERLEFMKALKGFLFRIWIKEDEDEDEDEGEGAGEKIQLKFIADSKQLVKKWLSAIRSSSKEAARKKTKLDQAKKKFDKIVQKKMKSHRLKLEKHISSIEQNLKIFEKEKEKQKQKEMRLKKEGEKEKEKEKESEERIDKNKDNDYGENDIDDDDDNNGDGYDNKNNNEGDDENTDDEIIKTKINNVELNPKNEKKIIFNFSEETTQKKEKSKFLRKSRRRKSRKKEKRNKRQKKKTFIPFKKRNKKTVSEGALEENKENNQTNNGIDNEFDGDGSNNNNDDDDDDDDDVGDGNDNGDGDEDNEGDFDDGAIVTFGLPEVCEPTVLPEKLKKPAEILNKQVKFSPLSCFTVIFNDLKFYTRLYGEIDSKDLVFEKWAKKEKNIYERNVLSKTEIKGAGPLMNGKLAHLTEKQRLFWYSNKKFILENKCYVKGAPFSDSFINIVEFIFEEIEPGVTQIQIIFELRFVKYCLMKKIVKDKTVYNQKNVFVLWEKIFNIELPEFVKKNTDIGNPFDKSKCHPLGTVIKRAKRGKKAQNRANVATGGGANANANANVNREEENKTEIIKPRENMDIQKINSQITTLFFWLIGLFVIICLSWTLHIFPGKSNLGQLKELSSQNQIMAKQIQLLNEMTNEFKNENFSVLSFERWKNNYEAKKELNFWSDSFLDLQTFINNKLEQFDQWEDIIVKDEKKIKNNSIQIENFSEKKKQLLTNLNNDIINGR